MTEEKQKNEKVKESVETVTEQIEVAGSQLVERVKQLVEEGNVRRLIFRAPDDTVMLEMTLTTTAVVGGVITLAAPWLAALGAIAALVTRMRIEVVREVRNPDTIEGKATPTEPAKPSSTGTQKVKIQVEDDE